MEESLLIREIKSPLDDYQLRPLDPRCRVVQFSAPLTDREFRELAKFLRAYPDVPFRIYGHYGRAPNLDFLKYFPFLTRFQADVFGVESWDGLAYLPDTLKFLALGSTQRRFSLAPIARFRKLAELYLEGHTKDIDVLSGFVDLVYLTLRSISLPDLSLLKPLRHLRSLDLKLGGTKDLSMLGVLGQLRYLELWMIRGLSDLSAVAELGELRYLLLQDLKNVSRLPSFATLHNLQRVHIENLKNLSDLRPIAVAPRLEELLLINMGHLTLDDLQCFCNHPTLKEAVVGLGSVRRNEAAASLLGLPTISNFKMIRQYIEPDVMRDRSSENRER